ncbi:MAG TPA: 16S rRNA (cytidine(1402)-2'-O)-methyltransferase [Patescibacteria group bacterium]|nr:16S rRNA (cytidine(1402)-2'-O)-methyltransferase [Patescibacteria group bacterium]
MNLGTLYIVATPIGNLADITLRALETLKKVDLIAAEDTRLTTRLLSRYEIKKPLISYHQHSRLSKIDEIIWELKNGKQVALVSDAGTPGIADPGASLILKALENKIEIIPIPGAQAAVTALSVSGFSESKFIFVGFLPKKKGRQTLLTQLSEMVFEGVLIFYESPYRINKTLLDLQNYFGDIEVVVARELTKIYESFYRGKISEVEKQIKAKGEFVICLKKAINAK